MTAGQVAQGSLNGDEATVAGWLDPALVIAFCVMFAFVLGQPGVLNDGDTLWQIRTGEWILNHRTVPVTDPFSFTAGDRRWFAHEWLAEVLTALAFRWGGMAGVMALAATAAGLTAAALLRTLRRFLPGTYAVLALVVAMANAAPSLLARPHLLAWPCLAVWCAGLVTARANRAAPSFWLLPVMLLWVNLHGSFFLGLLLPGAFLIEALLDPGANHRQIFTTWAAFILAAWGVALLNPDVIAGGPFPVQLVGMKSLAWIGEWEPTNFDRIQPLELIILAGLALGLSGTVKLPPIRALLFLGLIHGALAHVRNEQLLGIAGALILAEPIGACFKRPRAGASGTPWRAVAGGAALLATIALGARLSLPLSPDRTGETFAAVLDHVPAGLRERPVLNAYGLGGNLIFQGVRPFIDSRADLHGDAFLNRYRNLIAPDDATLDQVLTEYGIAWTIFEFAQPVVGVLDHKPGWRRLNESDGLVIHVHDNQPPASRTGG